MRCHRNGLDVILNPRVRQSFGPLERFWAFLTVKQILEKSKYSEDRGNLRKQALELALKYSFVTEVTSLVVVKPEEKAEVDPENAATFEQQQRKYFFNRSPGGIKIFLNLNIAAMFRMVVPLKSICNPVFSVDNLVMFHLDQCLLE